MEFFHTWRIDVHAWKYFGILRFTDMPGYYPQLNKGDD
jgi:hypothetical protein